MRKRHILKIEDIQNEEWENLLAGSFGDGTNKKLVAVSSPNKTTKFRVYNKKELIVDTIVLERAVEEYNNLS